jgi:MFS family permease
MAVSPLQIYLLLGVMVSALIAGVVLAPTMMQDMADPRVLSQVVALGTIISTVLTALGAPCVGIVSDLWGVDPRGVLIAVSIVGFIALLTAAILLAIGERPYLRTVAAARAGQ